MTEREDPCNAEQAQLRSVSCRSGVARQGVRATAATYHGAFALASRSWTFATAADIEATWFLAGHPLHDLSEQQLVECDTRNYGCDGGWPFSAMQYVAHIGGLTTYEDYPYKGIYMDYEQSVPTCDQELLQN